MISAQDLSILNELTSSSGNLFACQPLIMCWPEKKLIQTSGNKMHFLGFGYSGDYKFAWLGATTPIRASVWNIMGKIGNRLFFFEPLEALSLLYYELFANEIANFLVNGRKCCHYQSSNNNYLKHILNYLDSIYWIYQYGSLYKTPFWEDVKEKSSFHFGLKYHFDSLLDSYYIDQKRICDSNLIIGPFDQSDFRDIHSGMTQKNMSYHTSKVFRYPV